MGAVKWLACPCHLQIGEDHGHRGCCAARVLSNNMQVSPLPVSVILTDHDAFQRLRSTMQSEEFSPMRRDPIGTRRQPLARAARGGHPRATRACAEGAVLWGNSVPCRVPPDSQDFDASSGRWQVGIGSDLAIVDMGAGTRLPRMDCISDARRAGCVRGSHANTRGTARQEPHPKDITSAAAETAFHWSNA